MENISGYRKQKKKIAELEHDIKVMVLYPETEEAVDCFFKYSKQFGYESDNKDTSDSY